MVTPWKVYYGDGTARSSHEYEPQNLPSRGVQAIVQPDVANGFRVLTKDYYFWSREDERWYASDSFGLWDYLAQPGWKTVLFGRSITEAEFEAVYRDALNDELFDEKTGFREREHKPQVTRDFRDVVDE